ncbi:MAG: hypothetical protein NVS9B1_20610 [Candidatus Dormibacteraceae bacterium]
MELKEPDGFPSGSFPYAKGRLAELPISDSGKSRRGEKCRQRLLEDDPPKHFRLANEMVGSTTTVIQQHLTSFAVHGSGLRGQYTLGPMRPWSTRFEFERGGFARSCGALI